MKSTSKKSASKNVNRSSVKSNPFKAGQAVKYDGKKYEVRKAYVYHDRPFCIIVNGKDRLQVSANSLVKK
jgi:hypothetical protein